MNDNFGISKLVWATWIMVFLILPVQAYEGFDVDVGVPDPHLILL